MGVLDSSDSWYSLSANAAAPRPVCADCAAAALSAAFLASFSFSLSSREAAYAVDADAEDPQADLLVENSPDEFRRAKARVKDKVTEHITETIPRTQDETTTPTRRGTASAGDAASRAVNMVNIPKVKMEKVSVTRALLVPARAAPTSPKAARSQRAQRHSHSRRQPLPPA